MNNNNWYVIQFLKVIEKTQQFIFSSWVGANKHTILGEIINMYFAILLISN